MASLPNRCLEVVAGSVVWERSEMARAMAETVETVSSARPPKVSATSGINTNFQILIFPPTCEYTQYK